MTINESTQARSGHGRSDEILFLVVLTLCGLVLRLVGVNRDLWLDEIWSVVQAYDAPVKAMMSGQLFPAGLLETLLKPLVHLTLSNWMLRIPSVLFGVALIPVSYGVARRIYGEPVALLAATLVAFSWFQVIYAQEVRNYSALALFSALSLLLALQAWHRPRWQLWLGLGASEALAFYSHYFAVFPIATLVLFGVGNALALLFSRRVHSERRKLIGFAASQMVLLLFIVPSWPAIRLLLAQQITGAFTSSGVAGFSMSPSFLLGLGQDWGFGPGRCSYALLVMFFVGLLALMAYRNWTAVFVAALLIAFPIVFLGQIGAVHKFHPRYLIFMQPVYVMTAAAGIISLIDVAGTLFRRFTSLAIDMRKWGTYVAVALIVATSVLPLRTVYLKEKEGWRGAAAYLREVTTEQDRIFVPDLLVARYLALLQPRLSPMIEIVNQASAMDAAYDAWRDVWLVFPDWSFLRSRPGAQDMLYWGIYDGRAINLDFSHVYVKRMHKGLIGAGLKADTARLLESRLTSGSADFAQRVALAKLYAQMGQRSEAVNLLQTILRTSPNAWIWTLLADIQSSMGDTVGARHSYDAALRLNPNYRQQAWFHVKLGALYKAMGDSSRARYHFTKANTLSPSGGALRAIVTPNQGVSKNTLLTADGGPFTEDTEVEVCRADSGGRECTRVETVEFVSSSRIRFRMPPNAMEGTYLLRMFNSDGLRSGQVEIRAGEQSVPTIVAVLPSDMRARVGATVLLDVTLEDRDGWQDLSIAYLLLAQRPPPEVGDVYLAFNVARNQFFIRNDSGTGWEGGLLPGISATAENSKVKLLASECKVAGESSVLTIRFAVQFTYRFVGDYNIYVLAADTAGKVSGWSPVGVCRIDD